MRMDVIYCMTNICSAIAGVIGDSYFNKNKGTVYTIPKVFYVLEDAKLSSLEHFGANS
jgi:hypothetical protein